MMRFLLKIECGVVGLGDLPDTGALSEPVYILTFFWKYLQESRINFGEAFSISLIHVYDMAVKEIKSHWSSLWKKSKEDPAYGDIYSYTVPWSHLYHLGCWIEEFAKMGGLFSFDSPISLPGVKMVRTPNEKLCSESDKHCIPNEKLYRKNILNHREKISIELQTLLPTIDKSKLEETPSQESTGTDERETYDTVQAILPVLVLGYLENRRGPSNEKSKGNKEGKESGEGKKSEESEKRERIFKGTAYAFENLLCHEDVDAYSHELQNIGSIFKPKCWDKEYPKLKYAKTDPKEMENKLLYFGDIMLFLFLAYKMKNFCNLTLSCALFEEFSGSVGFFDIHFPRIDNGYTFHGTRDDPQKEKIIYYLDKMFGADINSDKRIELWNEALDRYVVFTINEVVCREENQLRRSFSEGEWAKNSWADELMSCPPVQGWLGVCCSHDDGIVDDSLYQEIKMVKLFQKKSYKRRLEKLISIRYSKKIMCPGGSKHSAKYRIKPVGDMSERDATRKWIKEEKKIYRLVNKFTANPKLKKGFYAYYAGIIRLAKSKKPKKPKKYRADEQIISRLKQVKMV